MRYVVLALVGSLLAASAQGQVSVTRSTAVGGSLAAQFDAPPATATPATVVSVAAANAAQPAAANPAADAKQKRLQKIGQLQFDRRPSAILKAWLEVAHEEQAAAAKAAAPQPAPMPPAEPKKEEVKKEEAKPAEPKQEEPKKEEPKTEEPKKEEPKSEQAAEPAPADEAALKAAAEAKAKAEQEAKAKAEQEAKAKEAAAKAAEAARLKAEQEKAEKAFDEQLKQFRRDVTLGRWPQVKAFIASLEKDEAKVAYNRLLDGLRSGPAGAQRGMDPQMMQQMMESGNAAAMQQMIAQSGQGPGAQFIERNRIAMIDLVGLIEAAPDQLAEEHFSKLGGMLRAAITSGRDLEDLLKQLNVAAGSQPPEKLERRGVARLLSAAGQEARTGEFLPPLDEAERAADVQALNLLARHYMAKHGEDHKATHLENAWRATQAVLATELPADVLAETETPPATPNAANPNAANASAPAMPVAEKTPEQKAAEEKAAEEKKQRLERKQEQVAALRRAIELAPRVKKELGQKWLDESFTSRIERGREILVSLGSLAATNLQSHIRDSDFRLKSLQLERTAVEALLRAAPETANQWRDALTMLAGNWLKEADVTARYDNRDPYQAWRRDRYGNFFYMNFDENGQQYNYNNQNQPQAIATSDMLDARPREAWLRLVADDLQPKFAMSFSQLHLKAGEDAEAFPFIERLAATHPDKARELAKEFLRVWTRNHNPNDGRDRENMYIYYFGYEQRADRIPLTRSKQERNLKELGQWITRLRALPIGELDEQLLAQAFTTSHSKAEVYRLEVIEDVFGSLEQLKPRTLAELIQQMRGNLAGVWRLPDVQKKGSTNRKQRDIQAEVQRGYELALKVVRQGLEKHPDHWALVLAEAAILHDENDYHQELEKSSTFSERRQAALTRYQKAAELYAKAVGDLAEDEQTVQAFEQWFYAGLGSVDLTRITAEKVTDARQPAKIREAMGQLPPAVFERHMELFANNLFTRLNTAKPELKFRYLKSGFEIVGDHKMAREARKLLDYYGDLVSEIRFEAKVDGADTVGEQPFGVFVNLVHTKEIERESGGFGRYLQNQNSGQNFFYNFGRPLQNYRDKFRDTVTQAVGEQFDVVSVTFQDPEVNSKAAAEYGWRVTPYAYLLLKAKGPQVDKIAPLRLDLDFLDTSGYAMLPVETPTVPIDAKAKKPPARPASQIALTQTLDERQAKDGKLIVEVRAAGRGLMPTLADLIDYHVPGFQQTGIDGGDLSVTSFDKDAADTTVLSERTWQITLRANDQETPPETFRFPEAKVPLKEALFQRYEDADLVAVKPEISLVARYDRKSYAWLAIPAVALGLVGVGGLFAARAWRRRQSPVEARFKVPEEVTPFNVLGLLRDIQHNNGLGAADQQELKTSIDRLEHHYFAAAEPQSPDLKHIAEKWVARAGK